MGPVLAVAKFLSPVAALLGLINGRPPGCNPTIHEIEERDRLQRAVQEQQKLAQRANEEADEFRRKAEREAEEMKKVEAALQAGKDKAEREAEEAKIALEAAEKSAEVEQEEAAERERKLIDQARKEREALEEKVRLEKELADEKIKTHDAAKIAAEEAAKNAEEQMRRALELQRKAERELRDGIQPVVTPSVKEVAETKRKFQYQEGLYHFAVAGLAGSGKSSLINALRGLKNWERRAAAVGVTETTLSVTRHPDPKHPFVWYDIPGAGTLKIPDWQYFNSQGLYVFDALIVLIADRFTATDVAILRNARHFKIPTYIVRSKADSHIRNVMLDMGFQSDDESENRMSRADLESAARSYFISATRQTVWDNLNLSNLPQQRVYIVSNAILLGITTATISARMEKKIIDEVEFIEHLLRDAHERRGGRDTTE